MDHFSFLRVFSMNDCCIYICKGIWQKKIHIYDMCNGKYDISEPNLVEQDWRSDMF